MLSHAHMMNVTGEVKNSMRDYGGRGFKVAASAKIQKNAYTGAADRHRRTEMKQNKIK